MKGVDERENMKHPKYYTYQDYVQKQREIKQNQEKKDHIDYKNSNFNGKKEKYYDNQDGMYHMTQAQLNSVINHFIQKECGEKRPNKGVMRLYNRMVKFFGTIVFWILALNGVISIMNVLM